MKKYLILLIIILCCGCSAKYELNFIDDKISDSLTVTYPRNGQTDSDIDSLFSNSFYAIGRDKLYNYKNLSNISNVILNLNYDYSFSSYNTANIPNSCFDYFKIVADEDNYYLLAGGAFKCSYYAYEYLDSLDIVINTNHGVIENNADEVVDGKYVWHIDKDDNEKELKFVIEKMVHTEKKKIDYKFLMYVGISISLFILLLVLGIFIRHKHVNKI